jgi:formylglycine-generating enzyme required for sulfatase activity
MKIFVWETLLLSCAALVAVALSNTVHAQEARSVRHFQDCPDCPEMIIVPPGHFTMTRKLAIDGRTHEDPEGERKEIPERAFDIASFALATTPVTRRQYAFFIRDTRRVTERGCHVPRKGVWVMDVRKDWEHPGFAQTDEDPVVCINWADAQAYLEWLNARRAPQSPYRLPTWEEMEYATRAGTTTRFYWGDQPRRDAANHGNERCLPCGPQREGGDQWLYTSPVGAFPPNPWGFYDLAGNVFQWVESCRTYMKDRPLAECTSRAVHGGSWLSNSFYLQTGERGSTRVDHRNNQIGFRVARSLSGPSP